MSNFEPTPLNVIAKIISGVVHPIIMPLLGTLLLINLPTGLTIEHEDKLRATLIAVVAICTLALPTFAIVLLRAFRVIQSVSLNNQHDRRLPFIITGICYTLCYYTILKIRIPAGFFPYNMAYPLMLGGTISVVLALVVNHWFKISIHMMGIGGIVGAIVAIAFVTNIQLQPLIILLLAAAGLTGFARLQLNAHTPAQVYTGFITGALCNSLLIVYFFR